MEGSFTSGSLVLITVYNGIKESVFSASLSSIVSEYLVKALGLSSWVDLVLLGEFLVSCANQFGVRSDVSWYQVGVSKFDEPLSIILTFNFGIVSMFPLPLGEGGMGNLLLFMWFWLLLTLLDMIIYTWK